jgi:hypothetical protein
MKMNKKQLKEGLADMAYKAESDHEVQMARAELYKIAKYSIKLHEMLKGVDESAGLEGWVQSKITKSADYLGSVYHHLDYQFKFDEVAEAVTESERDTHCSDKCCGADVKAEDCGCAADCKGCNCNDPKVSEGIDAMKKAGNAKADAEAKDRKASKKKNESYKESLASRLSEKVSSCCADCGKDSYTTLNLSDEELDEVAGPDKCWKGYKRAGTQKGTGKNAGKRVNKCVKA